MVRTLSRFAPYAAVGVVLLLIAWFSLDRRRETSHEPAQPLASQHAAGGAERERPPSRAAPEVPAPEPPEEEAAADDTMEGLVPAEDADAMAAAWSAVDLDEVRRALPGNLYFDLSAPTRDPEVIEERAAERARWNVLYGKILSGTGTEQEIRDYYDLRARLSTDYVEFATYILDHFGEQIPERDVGLLELARRLHLARLEEVPRKIEEALERKRQQDEARAAWLADEAAFRGEAPTETEPE